MGYVMERGALVDKMFHSVQLAFRSVPGSLAVTTLIICTFWGIASGLVGAVVVLMGVIAMRPMLNAGYDTRLAAGVITAGGTLGILIPPSVMIIVYAAVAGQSVVKLYAAAMFPGFFLALLYLVYIIGWVLINPKIAPRLPPEQQQVPVPPWLHFMSATYSRRMLPALVSATLAPARALKAGVEGVKITWGLLARSLGLALVPLALAAVTLGAVWWYVVIHSQEDNVASAAAQVTQQAQASAAAAGTTAKSSLAEPPSASGVQEPPAAGGVQEPPAEPGLQELSAPPGAAEEPAAGAAKDEPMQQFGDPTAEAPHTADVPPVFYTGFWIGCGVTLLLLFWYYWKFDAEQFEILRMLVSSVMPLAILTFMVLAVILFGITTATESAAVGAAGAFLMAWHAKTLNFQRIKEAVFLTIKTTSMVCWLFVGSALFSAVFALLGGQRVVEEWVLSMNLTPLQFLLLSQAIIFVLGWPLEWTEIIVIFVPIFLPLLQHFPDRPHPVGRAGLREPAGGLPVAAGRDVGLLPEGGIAVARDHQPDLRGHDALHADRDPVHGLHVYLARPDALAAEVPVRLNRAGSIKGAPRAPFYISRLHPQLPETSLSPITPDRIRRMQRIRSGAVESPSTTMPRIAVPAAPMPVQTA
jgi:TRAP-type mannitol/chloroaromatic compound transport system permease large subunit